MGSFPLANVTSLNIAQILKKCNDVSFVRSVRTCRRLYDISNQMDKATRIFCHEFLPVFVYFDEKMSKIMFDVPWSRRKEDSLVATCMTEEEDDIFEKEKFEIYREPAPRSQLNFILSRRQRSFHRKMASEELGQLLEFFQFHKVYLDTSGGTEWYPKFPLACEQVMKTFPYIRARSFNLDAMGRSKKDKGLDHKIYQLAYQHFKFKELYFQTTCHHGHGYGDVDRLRIDWYSLESLEALCSPEKFPNIQKEFISRWETGQTNLKHLELDVRDVRGESGSKELKFRATGNFALIEATPSRGGDFKFQYNHSVCNNRWAISYRSVWAAVYIFHDITDCDGCDCQTEFCFKKMIEVIAETIKWDIPVDFGPIVDQWNSMKKKTMKKLGDLLKPVMIRMHIPTNCCSCCC